MLEHSVVQQGVGGSIGHGYRSLQFVRDIIGEITLHLIKRLLLEHRMNQEPEDESQDEHDEERCGKNACHLAEHSHRKRLKGKDIFLLIRLPLIANHILVLLGFGGRLIPLRRHFRQNLLSCKKLNLMRKRMNIVAHQQTV